MEDAKLSTNTCQVYKHLPSAIQPEMENVHFQIKNYSQQISRGATFTLISLFLVCSALFTISVLLGEQLGSFADKIFRTGNHSNVWLEVCWLIFVVTLTSDQSTCKELHCTPLFDQFHTAAIVSNFQQTLANWSWNILFPSNW